MAAKSNIGKSLFGLILILISFGISKVAVAGCGWTMDACGFHNSRSVFPICDTEAELADLLLSIYDKCGSLVKVYVDPAQHEGCAGSVGCTNGGGGDFYKPTPICENGDPCC